MKLETGYVYHIKNEYFDYVKDEKLMKNHENGGSRPTYFCIKKEDSNLLWFIPMSSKVEKYERIMKSKIEKNGVCDTIIIGEYRGDKVAFLLQNMFPVTEKYIDHIDKIRNVAVPVVEGLKKELEQKANKIFKLKERGINLIFPDIDKISNILLGELKIENERTEKNNLENDTIHIDFGNILLEMEEKEFNIVFLKDNNGIFIEDKNNKLYEIEEYYFGAYLDQLITNNYIVEFEYVEESKNISEEKKEVWDIVDVENFMKENKLIENPNDKDPTDDM